MPLQGDQHRDTPATINPFAEHRTLVTRYTAQEIATLQSRLDKQLGPEYISTRPGPSGGRLHYIAGEKVIGLANEVFGFNGWSSSIQNVQVDFVDENPHTGKISLGLSTVVRVTLRDGTFHEDIGYGHIEGCKGKAAAFEKAKKEGTTDALKRALRNFGNLLGNCLYDKDYLERISKIKVAPAKWDVDNLYRHPDYAPVKKQPIANATAQQQEAGAKRQSSTESGVSAASGEFDDEYANTLFDETEIDHPHELCMHDPTYRDESKAHRTNSRQHQDQEGLPGAPRMRSMPQLRPSTIQPPPPQSHMPQPPKPPSMPHLQSTGLHHQGGRPLPPQTHAMPQWPLQQQGGVVETTVKAPSEETNAHPTLSSTTIASDSPQKLQAQTAQQASEIDNLDGQYSGSNSLHVQCQPPAGVPGGFVSGRSADTLKHLPDQRPPTDSLKFNPHLESPSIRRTHGINPGKSAPISRSMVNGATHAQPIPSAAPSQGQNNGVPNTATTTPMRTDFVNPSADVGRRIGMPPSVPGQAIHNRSTYRPPTMSNGTAVGVKRPVLADVSNIQSDGSGDPKRAKIEQALPQAQRGMPGTEIIHP